MSYESDLALRLTPHSPSVSAQARSQLPPGGSLCLYRCLSAFMLHVPYCNKECDQKAPFGRELASP